MENDYTPYVMKLAETLDYMNGKDALLFVEQMEQVDLDHLPEFIDLLYDGKEHLSEVLHTMNLISTCHSSTSALLDLD